MIYEPLMKVHCAHCDAMIEYYLSSVMGNDDKKVYCSSCKKSTRLILPNYMAVEMESGRPILRLDLGLVLTESALSDPSELASAWVSYVTQIMVPLLRDKESLPSVLSEKYHQKWWKLDKKPK